MKQVLIIHGGNSFSSHKAYLQSLQALEMDYDRIKARKRWAQWIAERMPDTDILTPNFPNSQNAVFEEWKIYFEKILLLLGDDVQLVGHSLGAMFLAKYLHKHPLKKPVKRLILIAGSYNEDDGSCGDFLVTNATNLDKSAGEIHLFHSQDDPVVPFTELAKFQQDIPTATPHTFTSRKHFNDSTFPELLTLLKQK